MVSVQNCFKTLLFAFNQFVDSSALRFLHCQLLFRLLLLHGFKLLLLLSSGFLEPFVLLYALDSYRLKHQRFCKRKMLKQFLVLFLVYIPSFLTSFWSSAFLSPPLLSVTSMPIEDICSFCFCWAPMKPRGSLRAAMKSSKPSGT